MKYLKQEERILSELTTLYEGRGYKKYNPTCFEEYSLYLENLDFLISKNVITFSSASGRLLALRPDVTLSVINHVNTDDGDTQKLFYTEKVYRQPAGGGEFREINQTGVEVVGQIDNVCEAEVASLIMDTLAAVSSEYLLDISHMGFTEGLIASFNLGAEDKAAVYNLLREKNLHDFKAFALSRGLSQEQCAAFEAMVNISGNANSAIITAESIALNGEMKRAVEQLKALVQMLSTLGYGDRVNINFSIANNADYYNGIIFNGYIDGVPHTVLTGGRYDKLLSKLGKQGGAIGFALYLGELERYFKPYGHYVDYLIVYDDKTQTSALELTSAKLKGGATVRLSRGAPHDLKFGEIINLTEMKND